MKKKKKRQKTEKGKVFGLFYELWWFNPNSLIVAMVTEAGVCVQLLHVSPVHIPLHYNTINSVSVCVCVCCNLHSVRSVELL